MRPTDSTRVLPRGFLVLLGLLLAARLATALWNRAETPRADMSRVDAPQAGDLVGWLEPGPAIAAARAQGRPVLYDFTAEWCGPCRMMQHDVFADRAKALEIKSLFVPARVLDRRQEDGRNPAIVDSLQKAYGIEGFPTLIAVAPDGREVGRVLGYPGPEATRDSLHIFHQRALEGAKL